jgi:hypothetical protein
LLWFGDSLDMHHVKLQTTEPFVMDIPLEGLGK